MTSVVPADLRESMAGARCKRCGFTAGSASWLCCCTSLFTLLSPRPHFPIRRPAFPASQGSHEGQRDRVWQCESSLWAVLELGQWKTQWGDYLFEVGEAHPPRGIATSFSSTFNDHTLWDHGWQWPQETRRGGLIKWGIRHCWLPTQWPSPSSHAFLSGCAQPPSAEADNPGTHFPSLLCI